MSWWEFDLKKIRWEYRCTPPTVLYLYYSKMLTCTLKGWHFSKSSLLPILIDADFVRQKKYSENDVFNNYEVQNQDWYDRSWVTLNFVVSFLLKKWKKTNGDLFAKMGSSERNFRRQKWIIKDCFRVVNDASGIYPRLSRLYMVHRLQRPLFVQAI